MIGWLRSLGRGRLLAMAAAGLAGLVLLQRTASSQSDLPTATVRQGTFDDVLVLRGEIRPSKSLTLSAPARGGDLRILRIARTGTRVNAGDVVIEFDRSTVLRTLGEKASELKRAEAEIDRIRAQRRIAEQELVTEVQKARFDAERARLDTRGEDLRVVSCPARRAARPGGGAAQRVSGGAETRVSAPPRAHRS